MSRGNFTFEKNIKLNLRLNSEGTPTNMWDVYSRLQAMDSLEFTFC